jgi:large subunit ribosomal protein L15
MPVQRRLPKRGFRPYNRTEYQVVNVRDLERVQGGDANPETLKAAGLVSASNRPIKILGAGEIARSLKVSAHAFSRTAREKIEKAGGEVNETV